VDRGIERFAIVGGCQYLLVMDYVVAAARRLFDAAGRKVASFPGGANLRGGASPATASPAGDHVRTAARL